MVSTNGGSPAAREKSYPRPEMGERGSEIALDAVLSADGVLYDYHDPSERDFEELIERDSMAASLQSAIILALTGAPFDIEAASGDKGEADFCREVLFAPASSGGMSTQMEDLAAQMATAAIFRKAFFEKVYALRPDGRIGYEKLAYRSPLACRIRLDSKSGAFAGFVQEGHRPNGEFFKETFDRSKAFVYIFGNALKPLSGRSVLTTAYHDAMHKRNIESAWNLLLQRFGGGLILGTTDSPNASDQRSLLSRLSTVRGGGVAVLGSGEQAQLVTPGDMGSVFETAAGYRNTQMARGPLLQFLMLSTGGTSSGSWALSKDHHDLFTRSCEATRSEMAGAFTAQVLSDLVAINFGPGSAAPRLVPKPLSETHLEQALTVWQQIATAASPQVSAGMMGAIAEKAAQALGIDPQKLQASAAPAPPGDVAPPNDALARSLEALRTIQSATGQPGSATSSPAN